jgi:hypothetical protein
VILPPLVFPVSSKCLMQGCMMGPLKYCLENKRSAIIKGHDTQHNDIQHNVDNILSIWAK